MLKNTIVVRTQAEFVHRYSQAPQDVAFLQAWHRHMLHIEVEIEVFHQERELEFILVKRFLNESLRLSIALNHVEKSCETVAIEIKSLLVSRYGEREMIITISEDGENAGKLYYTPESRKIQ